MRRTRNHDVEVDALTPFSDDSGVDTAPLWALVAEQLTAAGADLDALRSGATEADIAAAEAELGVPLPEDVRAIHRDHDGCSEALLDGREWLSLGRMVSEWRVWRDLLQRGCFEDAEPAPSGGVKPQWVNPLWIPVTHDGAGNHHCLDLDPGRGGVRGQVIALRHDDPERVVVAGSLYAFLLMAEWGAR